MDIWARFYLLPLPVWDMELKRRLFRGGHQGVLDRLFDALLKRIVDRRRFAVGRLVLVGNPRQSLPRLLGLTLPVPHTGIKSAGSQKLGVGSALGDAALIQHDDFVRADDGGQPVGDHQRSASARDALKRLLNFMLGVAV